MDAGRLDRRLTLQQPVRTVDETGDSQVSWSDVATVWAMVEESGGRELWRAQQVMPEVSARILIRHRDDVQADWRAVEDGRVWSILAVRRLGRKQLLELLVRREET